VTVPATMQALGHLAPAAGVLAKSKVDTKVLGEGITQSFPILTFKGKVWNIRYRGVDTPLLMPPRVQGGPQDTPQPHIDVVIINSAPSLSKIFYERGYVEGSTEPPDCLSVNGKTPDPASPKKQAEVCTLCPKNAWGSKTTEAGKQGKACQDSKRLVVVPAGDLRNEMFGGPMLLRVPPASLADTAQYSAVLERVGHTFFSVRTQLGFDHQQSYPKFVYTPIQALSEEEAAIVLELQEDPRTLRILSEPVEPAPIQTGTVLGEPHVVSVPAQVTHQPVTQPAPAVYVPPTTPSPVMPADPGPMPAGLVRQPTPAQPAPVAQVPVTAAGPAPAPQPFRVLSNEEMAALPPAEMVPYMQALQAHLVAQSAPQTAVPVGGRGRRRAAPAAVVPPPSPAPTVESQPAEAQQVVPATLQPALQSAPQTVGNPFGGGGAPLTPPPVPTEAGVSAGAPVGSAQPDAAIESLNAKLGTLLGWPDGRDLRR
jgi:hypothetical protein